MPTEEAKVCTCCLGDLTALELPPRQLLELGHTSNKQIEVWACSECDGEVVKLSLRS
jgi:hypothetical protein